MPCTSPSMAEQGRARATGIVHPGDAEHNHGGVTAPQATLVAANGLNASMQDAGQVGQSLNVLGHLGLRQLLPVTPSQLLRVRRVLMAIAIPSPAINEETQRPLPALNATCHRGTCRPWLTSVPP
jgi:hypothetical protein